jgi:hypothetical protein
MPVYPNRTACSIGNPADQPLSAAKYRTAAFLVCIDRDAAFWFVRATTISGPKDRTHPEDIDERL